MAKESRWMFLNLQVRGGAGESMRHQLDPRLGSCRSVNIMEFCKQFNASEPKIEPGKILPAVNYCLQRQVI